MAKKLHTFLLMAFTIVATAQTPKWVLRPYAAIADFPQKQNQHPHLKKVKVFDLTYSSPDGTIVKGFVIRPADTLKQYPVIIYNRGGNGSFGMVTEQYIVRFLSRIAAEGFIVAGSQLRGSEGSEGEDEFGGKTIEDVLALFTGVLSYSWADKMRVAQIGWSRGAITNFLVLRERSEIKATITIAGQADLLQTKRAVMYNVYRNRVRGYATDSVAATAKVSPIYQLEQIRNKKAALLFIHGDADERVPVEEGRQMHTAAQKLGLRSELWEYQGADHSLRKDFSELALRIVAWLKATLY